MSCRTFFLDKALSLGAWSDQQTTSPTTSQGNYVSERELHGEPQPGSCSSGDGSLPVPPVVTEWARSQEDLRKPRHWDRRRPAPDEAALGVRRKNGRRRAAAGRRGSPVATRAAHPMSAPWSGTPVVLSGARRSNLLNQRQSSADTGQQ